MSERKLASVQIINSIKPIDGADKIVVATMQNLGWECVIAKKDNINIGDKVVYVEVDGIMPERPEFEFLRERKFRIKTIKLKKQVSMGLILPQSALNFNIGTLDVGTDVSEQLGVVKYDVQAQEENELTEKKSQSKLQKFLMDIPAYRYIYLKLNSKIKGNWPDWIQKTDEDRVQVCLKKITENLGKSWYVSEKLDGSSAVYFTYKTKTWGIPRLKFGVGSRNIWLKTKTSTAYWHIAEKYDLANKLLKSKKELVINGEIIGGKIQGNKYKLPEYDFYVFNIVEDGKRYTLEKMLEFCMENELKVVPILYTTYTPDFNGMEPIEMVNKLIEMSKGHSTLYPRNREGIVCRLNENPQVSLKIINPDFLLEHKE
jgi:RNA ligase (TIGR02306 family)